MSEERTGGFRLQIHLWSYFPHMLESWDVDIADAGVRLDAIWRIYDEIPDPFLQKLVKDGKVLVDNRPVKNNYRLTGGEVLCVQIPQPGHVFRSRFPLEILYEDEDLIFVNKPKGMVVHPAPGHSGGTLVNGPPYHCGSSLSGISPAPGNRPPHRYGHDRSSSCMQKRSGA